MNVTFARARRGWSRSSVRLRVGAIGVSVALVVPLIGWTSVTPPAAGAASCADLLGTTSHLETTSHWGGTISELLPDGTTVPGKMAFSDVLKTALDGSTSGVDAGGDAISGTLSCSGINLYVSGPDFVGWVTGTVFAEPGGLKNGFPVPGDVGGSGTLFDQLTGRPGTWGGGAHPEPHLSLTPSTLPDSPGPVRYTVTIAGGSEPLTGALTVSDDHGGSCTVTSSSEGVGSCDLTEQASQGPYTVVATYAGDGYYAEADTTLQIGAAVAADGTAATGSARVVATGTGGTAGVDSVSEAQYGTNPVGNLTNGTNYFDVRGIVGEHLLERGRQGLQRREFPRLFSVGGTRP